MQRYGGKGFKGEVVVDSDLKGFGLFCTSHSESDTAIHAQKIGAAPSRVHYVTEYHIYSV